MQNLCNKLAGLAALTAVMGSLSVRGNDIEPGKEFYSATRINFPIVLDGNLNEWVGVPVLSDPKFAIPKGSGTGGNYVLFEEYQGGTWTGPDDQTSAVQVVYDEENVYFGFVVTDDTHQNSATDVNTAWNGDSVQLMIASSDREAQVALYNYAVGGREGAIGEVFVHHEAGPGGTEAVVRRDATARKTIYEIKLPAASMDLVPPLTAGTEFGLGMAINDGDTQAGQDGQKGWGGLGAHSIVFGKTPQETALVTLSTNTPGTDIFFLSAINPGGSRFTFRATDKGASIVDPASAKLTLDGQTVTLTSQKTGDATDFAFAISPPFAPGTEHTYTIEVKDTLGAVVTDTGTFRTTQPFFPAANIAGTNVLANAWRLRWVFATTDLIATGQGALTNVLAAGTAEFTGASADTTNAVINFGPGGLFGSDAALPDAVVNHESGLWTGDNYAVFGFANVQIPEESDYTFGVHSDDGFAMRIRGAEVLDLSGAAARDPADPEAVLHLGTTGDSNTRAVYHLQRGVYRIEFLYFEATGGDYFELYAAKGNFANDVDTDQWRLVGDSAAPGTFNTLGVTTNGWSVVSSDPGGDVPLATWADAFADLDATAGSPTNYPRLFIGDPETNAGYDPFPKNTTADDDNFALRANATLVVPATGTYVIGFNSDDGAYVRITGQTFTEIIANTTGLSVIDNDSVTCDCLTGDSNTRATISLAAGEYPIEAGMFDQTGGGYLRVVGGAEGSPRLDVLAAGGAGSFTQGPSLRLTSAAPGVEPSTEVRVTATRSAGNLTIQWTPTGGTLQTATALGGTPSWTDVGTANPATVPIGTGNAFYRVRQ
jgi:hypothetical protein